MEFFTICLKEGDFYMAEIPIRNMYSRKAVPPRFCDLIIEGNDVKLRKKEGNRFEEIPWDVFKHQVEEAMERIK